jgi:protoheme IX farnesyltransferase
VGIAREYRKVAPTTRRLSSHLPGARAPDPMRPHLRALAIATTASTLVLIGWGGLVRATGSGDGCPDWPRCFGSWIPRWEIHTLIEYTHRTLAVVSGLLALAMAIVALVDLVRGGDVPRPAAWGSIALAPLFLVQGALGGWVVLSGLDPAVVTVHFAVAFLVLGLVVAIAVTTGTPRTTDAEAPVPADRAGRGPVRLATWSVVLTYVLLLVGTYVRAEGAGLAFRDWPLMGGRLLPSLAPDGAAAMALHRALAVATATLVIWVAVRTRTAVTSRRCRRLATWSVAATIAQIVLGGINVVSRMAPAPRAAHVGAAALVWASVVALAVALRIDGAATEAAPGEAMAAETAPRPAARVGAFVALTKPRIIVLLLVTTVPAMFLAAGEVPSPWLIAATLLGGTLAAGAANAFNMYLDRDIDEMMRRTRRRPLPGHRIEPLEALRFGYALGVLAVVFLAVAVNVLAALLALSAIVFYVFVYTMWLKRSTAQNIVIGGAAGAAPVLVGWAAVTGGLAWPAWILFAVIFVWTPPHFWALAMRVREDYAAAGIPMLPVVKGDDATRRQILAYSVALVATTLLLVPARHIGVIYLAAAVGLGAAFVGRALVLWRRPTDARAWGLFKYSVVYLGALFGAVAIDALV